jgi:ceramide glucosyltransferase
VNQLVTLARSARYGVLVVSDSNVRVDPGYLAEIVALLEDEAIGLVTHPISGEGEVRVGSLMDHLHLTGAVTPGIVAAKALAARDIVVGKSMALRRADLVALGGFESVQDVLAEDYVMGKRIGSVLGKRVAVARTPVHNVSASRSLADFNGRYRRWAVLQRQAAGRLPYAGMALLNPILLATVGAALSPGVASAGALAATCGAKIVLDGAAARLLRPGGFRVRQLAVIPVKDLVFGSAWALGLFRREVDWRGNRIVVGPGTRIDALPAATVAAPAASPATSP